MLGVAMDKHEMIKQPHVLFEYIELQFEHNFLEIIAKLPVIMILKQ